MPAFHPPRRGGASRGGAACWPLPRVYLYSGGSRRWPAAPCRPAAAAARTPAVLVPPSSSSSCADVAAHRARAAERRAHAPVPADIRSSGVLDRAQGVRRDVSKRSEGVACAREAARRAGRHAGRARGQHTGTCAHAHRRVTLGLFRPCHQGAEGRAHAQIRRCRQRRRPPLPPGLAAGVRVLLARGCEDEGVRLEHGRARGGAGRRHRL